jgi:hypothetical protein
MRSGEPGVPPTRDTPRGSRRWTFWRRRPVRAAEYGVRRVSFIAKRSRQQLMDLGKLIDAGIVRPIVFAILPLAQERGAVGHKRVKFVLTVHAEAPCP